MNKITEKQIKIRDYLTKSNLPASDYVINPYVGCPHGCKYCYACFMKRFTGHSEPWGTFIDIKSCDKPIDTKRIAGKSVFMSSVTDCYNPLEEKYQVTRGILEQIVDADIELGISTKSKLILRDIDLLKKFKSLKVSMSLNTLDESFRSNMDNASTIEERFETLEKLHNEGIHTVLFMSPMFPKLTDFRGIIERSKSYVDEYWFENLNLRGSYKVSILAYIDENYPELSELYDDIFTNGNKAYWAQLCDEIDTFCKEANVAYTNYFYHEKLVSEKKERN